MSIVDVSKPANIVSLARILARAQNEMAAKASEDSQHWHHRLLADVLTALADKVAADLNRGAR